MCHDVARNGPFTTWDKNAAEIVRIVVVAMVVEVWEIIRNCTEQLWRPRLTESMLPNARLQCLVGG